MHPTRRLLLPGMLLVLVLASFPAARAEPGQTTLAVNRLLADGQFVFGPNVGALDLAAALEGRSSTLLPYTPVILAQADYFSVNPRVLATVLELRFGHTTPGPDLAGSIHDTAESLREAFTRHRYTWGEMARVEATTAPTVTVAGKSALLQAPNSASFALAATLADGSRAIQEWQKALDSFDVVYRRFFPESDPLDESNNITAPGAPPADLLQLPFPVGESWAFNGPHNKMGPGYYEHPWPSMDFGIAGNCGSPPDMWAAAAAGGYVEPKTSEYGLRINHGDGWYTAYYHLRDIWSRFTPGSYVNRNDLLGRVSCLYDPGGYADVPHVHFSLLYNGEFVDIAQPLPGGDHTRLSGYQVVEGSAPYGGSLVREQTIPAYNPVYNDGGSYSYATLNLAVRLENPQNIGNFNHGREVAVVVMQPGTDHILYGPRLITTDWNGNYNGLVLDGLQPGTYDVCAKARQYLGQCAYGVPVNPGNTISIDFSSGGSTPARLGDIDPYGQDNEDNTIDYETIRAACMNSCGTSCPPACEYDLNQDGIFDSQDVSLVGYRVANDFRGQGNFGRPFANKETAGTRQPSGSIILDPSSASGYIGDIIPVSISLDTGGDTVTAADVKIYYDPALLQVVDEDGSRDGVQISNGSIFPTVYRNNVDTVNGIIWFSAGYQQFSGLNVLANVRFRVLAATPSATSTTIVPEAVPDDSTDSNSPQSGTAWDVVQAAWPTALVLYGSPERPAPSFALLPAPGAIIGQTLLHVSAQVDDPGNQEGCVTWVLTAPSGESAWADDCDGSDGWSAVIDTSGIPDQAGLYLHGYLTLRTGGQYTVDYSDYILDRTPPSAAGVTYSSQPPYIYVNVNAVDNLSPQLYLELWVNEATDGSDTGAWRMTGNALAAPGSWTALPWDTTGYANGFHLLAVNVLDHAGAWSQRTAIYNLGWSPSSFIFLPFIVKAPASPPPTVPPPTAPPPTAPPATQTPPPGNGCYAPYDFYCGAMTYLSNDMEGSTDRVDSYACSPWDESGPEIAMRFIPTQSGPATVTLFDTTADVDVFVLQDTGSGCDPATCIAYDDAMATFDVVAGQTYYLVVDGYMGAVGYFSIQLDCAGK